MEQRAKNYFAHPASANRYLPAVVAVLFGAVVVYELAAITRVVLASAPTPTAPHDAAQRSTVAHTIGEAPSPIDIAGAHLFGTAPETAATAASIDVATPAPDSTLDVRLQGILFGEGGAPSQVIIAGAGSEQNYTIGERIEGAGDAALRAIYVDRAIIERDGRLETLRPPKEGLSTAGAPPLMSNVVSVTEPESQPGATPSPESVMSADTPPPLSSIVSVAPGRDASGTGVTFAINLGRHWNAFTALGLKARAQVISVNGIALGDDPVAGPQLFREALGTATTASIMVLNDDATAETIFLDSSRLAHP